MQLKLICEKLQEIENSIDVNSLKLEGVTVWPLIRFSIWMILSRDKGLTGFKNNQVINSPRNSIATIVATGLRKLLERISRIRSYKLPDTNPEVLFISRPCYLQKIDENGMYIDRIVDPIYSVSRVNNRVEKLYISYWGKGIQLKYKSSVIKCKKNITFTITDDLYEALVDIAGILSIDPDQLSGRFHTEYARYKCWYVSSKTLLNKLNQVNKIYVTSCYFPDMMGLIAAARKKNITTIDIQHGKQGLYQGMYSWWTKIPEEGYEMLPNKYWCWGEPSRRHIMNTSSNRRTHIPFVGGYPWLDYYKRKIYIKKNIYRQHPRDNSGRVVLVTLQPESGGLLEPIPDFITNYLNKYEHDTKKSELFIFRIHPNHRYLLDYCQNRLADIDKRRYVIHDGASNLYDDILLSSHHVTAYSSCCYEALAFNVPTLLFGTDALDIYKDDIDNKIFRWAETTRELESWLLLPSPNINDNNDMSDVYIQSSMSLVNGALDI